MIRTLRPHAAGRAKVAFVHEPDARQRDIRRLGQARHDAPEEFSDGADLGQIEKTFLERVKLRRVIGSQVHACVIAELANEDNVNVKSGKLRRALCHQPRSIAFQITPHGIDCAHPGPCLHLSQLFHHFVVDEHFPKLDDLNIGIVHFPNLSLG